MITSTVYILNLGVDRDIAEKCAVSLQDFAKELTQILGGDEVKIESKPAPEWIETEIIRVLDNPKANTTGLSAQIYLGLYERGERRSKVLVLCRPDHRLAKRGLADLPHAEWGFASPEGALAVAYGDYREYPIWHELLHTYGADDCYDEKDCVDDPEGVRTTCGTRGCIMGYGVLSSPANPPLVLCHANAELVRKHLGGQSNG